MLTWCRQALAQGNPNPKARISDALEPPDLLLHSLERIVARDPARLPTLEELTTRHRVGIAESWRQAAKASALGEHDLGPSAGRLDHREWLTLAEDVADITQAVLVLDRRYRQHVDGWQPLHGTRDIDRRIADCGTHTRARFERPDYNIDWRGWRPPDPQITVAAGPMTQVIAAEHRLLNSLTAIPSMTNLRHVLISQRELSHLAANLARTSAPEQAASFRARERTYRSLCRASSSAAGLAGTGAVATQHSADATTRLAAIPPETRIARSEFRNLSKLFRHVDNTLCSAIEQGFSTRLYLVRCTRPRIDTTDGRLVHQSRTAVGPVQRRSHVPLITIARRELRTDPVPMTGPGDAAIRRADLRAAIDQHRSRSDGVPI
ncbi:hypothetical protein OH802_21385 [Nocardioides sp. NBC_00850]|uniref:hypothetical protein n=1 Tax=Nocardioides sp. NBC_00850 TaxID=2976001 RepID=UPI003866B45C|nr:hypothetical protein OH802_21385 [Nocardioides sp. NBC_00850]